MKYYRVENQRVPSTLTWKRKVLYLENNQGEIMSKALFLVVSVLIRPFKIFMFTNTTF